jgi:anthranilate synthase/aminodeoxychorismate synthase-like glutamine amidotransferase
MSTPSQTTMIAGREVPMTGVGRRIVLVDNYDSFTYNLYQYLLMLGAEVEVVRNDEVSAAEIAERDPDGIVLSPGPSSPEHAGITPDVIRQLGPTTPMLGVCLGHQAMGMVYGGDVIRAEPVHGKRTAVEHTGVGVFAGLPSPLEAGRYHSLAIKRETMPEALEVTAWSPDGLVMGVRHREHPVEGIQFHPESILTDDGAMMLSNWLANVPVRERAPAA